jgi:kinesin family protein C1
VPVFDTESRMESMEREFLAFKQKMESETSQASDLKDTIKVLQTRGKLTILFESCFIG